MSTNPIISVLFDKKKEILGSIESYEALIKKARLNLSVLDQTIALFDESYTKTSTRKMPHRYFETGEAKKLILDVLKSSDVPLKTNEIALRIAEKKGIPLDNEAQQQNFQKTIIASLSTIEASGLVQRVGKDGLMIIWKIKELASK